MAREEPRRAATRIGYDPWLHTAEGAEKLAKACAAAGATLVAVEPNPIDALWHRPPCPAARPGDAARPALRRRGRGRASSRASAPRSPSCKRRRAGRLRSARRRLDLQHPRLATSRTRRCRSPSPSSRARAARRSMSTAASSRTTCATISKRSPTCASPPSFARDLAALGAADKTVRLDQATAADALARLITGRRRQGRRAAPIRSR